MGTSLIDSRDFIRLQDHPHAYGDKSKRASLILVRLGSSPRVWGQDIYTVGDKTKAGIIPTRMGTSLKIML